MNISLLFRKHTPLSEDGLPWLDAGEVYPFPAKRNPTGAVRISAILVRSLLSILEGYVLEARCDGDFVAAYVKSRSTPGSAWCLWSEGDLLIPHGSNDKLTYHVGILAMIQALRNPAQACDLLEAYLVLLERFKGLGMVEALLPELVRAADELYYYLRFGDALPVEANDRLAGVRVMPPEGRISLLETWSFLDLLPLNNPSELKRVLKLDSAPAIAETLASQ